MKRRAVLFAAALAVISLASSAARAATVVVTDSGALGSFTMTNIGISGTTATILITGIPNSGERMETVNGAPIPFEPVTFGGPVTMKVTPTGVNTWGLALDPATYSKTVGGVPGSQAVLDYNLSTGTTFSPLLPNFFNASGHVTGVSANANPLYDFSLFAGGTGTINATFTATAFLGATSFSGLFTSVGAVATGSGSFSQAVPEPASWALLGIGMTGFLAFRRFFKKTSVA